MADFQQFLAGMKQYAAQPSNLAMGLSTYGMPAQQAGLAELVRLLQNQGRTDPRLLNMNLAQVDRGTQAAQDATAAYGARSGLSGSGALAAIQAAQGQGGMATKARLRAEDAAQQDQNQRMNLQLLRDLVIGPGLDVYGIQQGQLQQSNANRQNRRAAQLGTFGSLLGAFAGYQPQQG